MEKERSAYESSSPLEIPAERLLMGPGPSNVSRRVREAMARPLVGHLDPRFLQVMNRIQDLLRRVFRTSNRLTLPISGTGSAGMEAAVLNFIEPGDPVLVGVHGVFGRRLAESARRAGGEVTAVEVPFGLPLDTEKLAAAGERCRPRIVAAVHAETSTGVLQPLEPIREICDRFDGLLLVDCVTSLAGHPVRIDEWGVDVAYSGTQKCLSCPPGLAPLTASERALEKLRKRKSVCPSWYFDLSLVENYWGDQRSYHHTAPISMNFALREALEIVVEEGLEPRWERHRRNHLALVAGLEAMGLSMHVAPDYRLWPLNTVTIPEGVDGDTVRDRLLTDFNLEVGTGLGDLAGKVWRVGLMGENANPRSVFYFLQALGRCLQDQGVSVPPESGIEAARESYGD